MKRTATTKVIAALLALMLAFAGAAAQPAGAGKSQSAAIDELGPWAVGYETFEITDASRDDRTLPIDVWYPVDAVDAVGVPPAELDLLVTSLPLEVALDAPTPASVGGFPLVVFSHGSGGIRAQSWDLMEHLASHGFVVVAPDHVGNTALDGLFGTTLPGSVMVRYRPLDVSFVIDEMLAYNSDPTHRYAGLVDADRIAVAGHSFGGYTALAVAGGVADIPADDRVDAIIPLAGASGGMSDENLASIEIPTLFLSATDDETVALDPGTTRPWALISSYQAYRVDLINGGHSSFTNICDLVDVLLDAGLPPVLLQALISNAEEGCAPELMDIDEALRLTNLYSTAFLKKVFHEGGPNQPALHKPYAQRNHLSVNLYVGHGSSRRLVYEGPPPPLND